jgi:septal ring factor EnvC (AmiA/AmiB activator)
LTARRNQLVILLLFFCLIGIFSGVAIWLISQSQQKERDLLQVQSDLEKTSEKMQILTEQNKSALTSQSKLQNQVKILTKQLDVTTKQNAAQAQMLKEAQTKNSALATVNSDLSVKLSATERQLTALQQSFKPTSAIPAKSTVPAPTIFAPASPAPAKR